MNGLAANATLTDTFTASTADGTSQVVTVTITGANDAAVIGGTSSGGVTEAGALSGGVSSASGDLSATDVDNPADSWQGVSAGTATTSGYGTYMLSTGGLWLYTLNNANPTVNALTANDTLTDSFTAMTADGTSKIVTVTIYGANDAAIISGTSTGAVTEAGTSGAGTPTATGDLNATDVDNPADSWQAVATATATTGGYGTFTLSATGVWQYTLDNANPTVDALAANATLTDTFTVRTADGTSQVVTVTITGADDEATDINLDDIALGSGGFKIIGENASDLAGFSLSSAGDINGDGYDDLIVGAPNNDAGGSNAGAAYVVYGRAAPFTSIDLDTIAAGSTDGFKITGQNSSDRAGISVASAGDINGDGYDDLIVGAYQNDGVASNAGAAYVIYGRATAISTIDLDTVAAGTGGFKISGVAFEDYAGVSVASAGDINGDGYDDLIVGAHLSDAGGTDSGTAYVVYGSAAAIASINLSDIALGTGGFRIAGETAGDWAGYNVAGAGDVNGDGYDDLIVSAHLNDAGGTQAGAAYVVYGRAAAITSINLDDIAAGTGGFKITGQSINDSAGTSVASAGDINRDGYDDLIIGARANDANVSGGATYVVYGAASGLTAVNLDNIALGDGGFKIIGENANDYAGAGVASAGDINGDGHLDLIIGAPLNAAGGGGAGAAYVVYGHATPFTSINLDDIAAGTGGFKIIGENAGDVLGYAVASAGDINGDGYDDLMVGSQSNNAGGTSAGAAYVIYGGQDLPNNTSAHIAGTAAGTVTEDGTTTVSGTLTVTQANQSAGTFTASNQTGSYGGFALLADGTWTYTLNNANSAVNALNNGQHLTETFNVVSADGTAIETVSVTINGHTDPVTSINLDDIALGSGGFKIIGETASDAAGFSLSSAGDINGDGYDDLIVGASNNDAGGFNAGAAYVIYGSATPFGSIDLDTIATGAGGFKIIGQNASDLAGASVASAGDINGDGYDDLIVGANLNDSGAANAGAAYVVYGNAAAISTIDLDTIAAGTGGFKISGAALDDNAGGRVASAGDINSDGYDDLIVGAYRSDVGGSESGAAYVVYGSAAAITSINLSDIALGTGGFRIAGEASNDWAGYGGVAGAGDVNGDGYDDLLVSAHLNDAGGTSAGAAYVVYGRAAAITSINLDDIAAGTGGFKITGENAGDFAGAGVASAGDINRDGYDDLIIGARGNNASVSGGAAYVVYGAASGLAAVNLDNIALGNGGFKIIGENANDYAGVSVASAGDINGDGYLDLIIGAPANAAGGTGAGAAYVVYGHATPFTSINLDDIAAGTGGFKIIGENAGDLVGYAVASAGDINGDGYDDLMVDSQGNDAGGSAAGAAYVIYGGAYLGGQSGLTVNGTSGVDTLTGKAGDDVLFGGNGADVLTGGLGADIFKYTATSQGGDTIKDFNLLDNDMIGIFRDLLGVTDTGALQADGTTVAGNTVLFESVNGANAAAQNNSAKLIYDTANHDLYYDSDGGASSSARILLAHLEAGTLDASHIALMA